MEGANEELAIDEKLAIRNKVKSMDIYEQL